MKEDCKLRTVIDGKLDLGLPDGYYFDQHLRLIRKNSSDEQCPFSCRWSGIVAAPQGSKVFGPFELKDLPEIGERVFGMLEEDEAVKT